VIIFIFFCSLFYLLVYKKKVERKKGIVALAITTIITLLLSAFIVLPSYLQISISSRMGFSWQELLNSQTGPITDKGSMFMFGGIMWVGLLLLLKDFRKNKHFITWYIPTSLILLIPVIVEPINKIWHFGSYAFFPYRAGFIMMFLLIVGACYSLEQYSPKKIKIKPTVAKKITVVITTIITCILMIYLTYTYYNRFQLALETLTISIDHFLLWMLLFMTFLSFLGCFLISLIHRKLNTFSLILISVLTITHITCTSFLYLGIDKEQKVLTSQYVDLQKLEKTYQKDDYYRVKNMIPEYITNSGMIMRYHTLDHFTSLTDKNNLETLKKLGYSSMWVKTNSKGGTLFTDSLLANKYILSKKEVTDPYYEYVDQYGDLLFYQLKETPSYGYFLNHNIGIMDQENSFAIQNSIYQSITNSDQNLFTIEDNFILNNIKKTKEKKKDKYEIIDKDAYNYLESSLTITKRQRIYLEILNDLNNNTNLSIYRKFNIYINDKLFKQKALTENDNGVIDLGDYESEEVNIKIVLLDDVLLDNITLATMDKEKYEQFVTSEKTDLDIKYIGNKIKVDMESDQKQLLFLPIAYNDGYQATLNGKSVEIVKVFDNYIGIQVTAGENNITISFIPKGFIVSSIISLITLVGTILLIKKDWYTKIIEMKWLQNVAYLSYLGIYIILVILIYFLMTIAYLLSYFIYFSI
ncbi:MAG: YfhO family protein, partial [bacterium]|nr:YfhO family protein [bacterium]